MNTQYDLVSRALDFAVKAHGDQKRRYTGEPYVMHCMEVALRVSIASVRYNRDDVAAALLHDTLEDTATTYGDLVREFGVKVADLVVEVTDVSRPEDGNRAVRKAMDRAHLAKATRDAQTIKLADLISNSKSILAHDPDFARVYLREKAEILRVLTLGCPDLRAVAEDIVKAGLLALTADIGTVKESVDG